MDKTDKAPVKRGRPSKSSRHHEEKERERQLAVINERFLDSEEMPYDRERIEGEINFLSQMTGRMFIGMGNRLILLKENEGHGGFLKCLERIGLHYKMGERFMKCAVVAQKVGKLDKLSNLTQQKILELGTLDDEELAELGEGGTVYGISLDAIHTLSHKELREGIKEAKEKLAASEESYGKLLEAKDRKINELELKVRQKTPAYEWNQRAADVMTNANAALGKVIAGMSELGRLVGQYCDLDLSEYRPEDIYAGIHCQMVVEEVRQSADDIARMAENLVLPLHVREDGFNLPAEGFGTLQKVVGNLGDAS